MKSKLVFLLTIFVVVILSITLFQMDKGQGAFRVHQHEQEIPKKDKNQEEGSTHLPIVKIDTKGQDIPGELISKSVVTTVNGQDKITSKMEIIDKNDAHNTMQDMPTLTSEAEISYRGNTSRAFDKKSLSVRLVKKNGENRQEEIMGMGKDNEWILNGPFLDRTLMRNYVALNIAGEIMEYAPNVRYCELYINEQYQGLYLCMERIAQGENRINIQKSDERSATTSYVLRLDRDGKGDHPLNNFSYYTYRSGISTFDVMYPGKKRINDKKMKYIEEDINRIEKSLYSYDLNSSEGGYEKDIDRLSFAQYFIINEFFLNVDAGHYSTYYYKDVKGKMKLAVWDFNNAVDNYIDTNFNEDGFNMINAPWFDQLIKDEKFINTIVFEYRKLRKGILKEENILKYIEDTENFIKEPRIRNYEKWGYVFDLSKIDDRNYLLPRSRNYQTYEEAVEQLESAIVNRGRWLDEHIETLYQYCQDSKTRNTLLR